MSQTAQKIRRLEVELESGGNLRYEQGSPSVSWCVIVASDHLICYLCTGIVAVWTWLTLVYHHMMYWLVRLYYALPSPVLQKIVPRYEQVHCISVQV